MTESAETLGIVGGPPQGALVAADFNNDGFFDIIASGRGNGIEDTTRRIMLYINENGKKFIPRDGPDVGLAVLRTTDYNITYSSAVAVDLNNDGLIDVVVGDANRTYRVFRNLGDFRFKEIATLRPGARMARPASADINEDGLMDLVVNEGKVGLTLYTNRSTDTGGWVEVAVNGLDGNTGGVGALVEVFKAGKLGDRTAYVGMQHVPAENDNHVPLAPHFGLGPEKAVDVRVTLPTGEVLEAKDVKTTSRIVADFVAKRIELRRERGK